VKPAVIAVCALLLGSAAAGAAEDALDGVMRSLAARRHGEADFIEQQFLALLKRPLESSGTLIYDAPDRLQKITREPRAETLLLEGDVLTVRRGHRSRVLDLKTYPQLLPFIGSLRATLAGDRAQLESMFRLEFSGSVAHWTLRLTPLDAELQQAVSRIQIDGTGNDLSRVEIRQPDGDRSLMTLRPHAAP